MTAIRSGKIQPRSTADAFASELSEHQNHTLRVFESLPDDALVDVQVASTLLRQRSRTSLWRDIKAKRLSAVRVGPNSVGIVVGSIRRRLREGY